MNDGYIPPSIRIPNLECDSSLEHVDYNIERLSEMLTNEGNIHGNIHPFEVLNCIVPIIIGVCRLVDKPAQDHEDDTFCLQTRLKSCHQEDIKNLKGELNRIRGNDIYKILKDARNNTVAHINTSYAKYGDTQSALLKDAICLIERKDRLKKLIKNINSLIHKVEMSIKKEEGKPLNVATFTIRVQVTESD